MRVFLLFNRHTHGGPLEAQTLTSTVRSATILTFAVCSWHHSTEARSFGRWQTSRLFSELEVGAWAASRFNWAAGIQSWAHAKGELFSSIVPSANFYLPYRRGLGTKILFKKTQAHFILKMRWGTWRELVLIILYHCQ